jgi:proteasome lid subunit RPN8/RPN11
MVTVKVRKNQLDYFRKVAREDFPLEVEAYLIGSVISPTTVIIDKFVYTKKYAVQTVGTVQWSAKEFTKVEKLANKMNARVIGSIHSHPNCEDAVVSETDYNSHFTDGWRILGICLVRQEGTLVRFWVQETSLPCKIVYK